MKTKITNLIPRYAPALHLKIALALACGFCILNYSVAQPSVLWQQSLGGTSIDVANSVQQTTDGGYIVAGGSESNNGSVSGNHGGYDYWIAKLDGSGNVQWQNSLGGTSIDVANSVQQTTDGGYIVAGYSESNNGSVSGNHGGYDYWIAKLDGSGNVQWQQSLGGTGYDIAYSIQQTTDGGYIVAGGSESNDGNVSGNHGNYDYWVAKLDGSGNVQWQQSLGGTANDVAYSIQQTTDGGYIVAGYSQSNNGSVSGNHGGSDYWIVKLDGSGNVQWQNSLGGTNNDIAYSIQQTTDGGYIVAGSSESNNGSVSGNHGGSDYWIAKLDGSGNVQWQNSPGGTNNDVANSIQQTTDGGYIVAGGSQSNNGSVSGNHGGSDYWIAKLDGSGNVQWQTSLGGTANDVAYSIQQTTDGGYIAAGGSQSNNGSVSGNHGLEDYWVAKLAPYVGIEEEQAISIMLVSPNPVQDVLHLSNIKPTEITVTNLLGETMLNTKLEAFGKVDISTLTPGVYFIHNRQRTAVGRFVKQ